MVISHALDNAVLAVWAFISVNTELFNTDTLKFISFYLMNYLKAHLTLSLEMIFVMIVRETHSEMKLHS